MVKGRNLRGTKMKLSVKNKLERATYEILNSDSLAYLLDISLDWDSFACPVFHFSIIAKGHHEKNRDKSLGESIRAVFGSFVNISPYPIVIIYSDEGNRQMIRQRLFDRWFNATDVSGFRCIAPHPGSSLFYQRPQSRSPACQCSWSGRCRVR